MSDKSSLYHYYCEAEKLKPLRAKNRALRQQLEAATALLVTVWREEYHYPDGDFHEYCSGCGKGAHSVPAHHPECLTVKVVELLRKLKALPAPGTGWKR